MAFEISYYNFNSNKDDIEFVTEFPCLLGHPVNTGLPTKYENVKTTWNSQNMTIYRLNYMMCLEYSLLRAYYMILQRKKPVYNYREL